MNMNTPSIICTSNSITVVFAGEAPKVIRNDHPNFNDCKSAIKNRDWKRLYDVVNVEASVRNYFYNQNRIRVANGTIYYDNEPVHGLIVDRVFQFMRDGLPFEPLLKFIENLMGNPSYRSREELYKFLEHEGLPITEDGHFLAYKAVRGDYFDIYSGKFYNGIGCRVTMPRPKVDDDCNRGCSAGLHAGSLEYVRNYGNSDSKFLIVKINPRDVVSVPSEDSRKLRCCEYVVLSEFKEKLTDACYTSSGDEYEIDDDGDDDCEGDCGYDDDCHSDCCKRNDNYYNYYKS